MKHRASVVIIGGGITGCSIAYHLAKRGLTDVVVLEKRFLASGATGRCGAGVRQQWGTEMNLRLSMESVRMFENLEEELAYNHSIEFKQGGYLLVAYSDKQWEQFRKNVALQRRFGLAVEELTPAEAQKIVPHLNIEGLVGATFCQKDGHANPFHVTQAYAEAAKRLGVEINLFTEVTGFTIEKGKITGVITNRGEIATERVVLAAGGWSKRLADMAGLNVPIYPERHQILVTEPLEPVQGPMVMSFQHSFYCQQTPHGSFIMGIGDPNEPHEENMDSTWEFTERCCQIAAWMLPLLKGVRIVRQWAGLYTMSPDRQPIFGPVPELEGLILAVGFSGHGFMIGPMTGVLIAEHLLGLPPSMPIEMLSIERFARGELILEPSVV